MAALATLTTTTLVNPVSSSDTSVLLSSASGVVPGLFLAIDAELMKVISLGVTTSAGVNVNVIRGQEGTSGTPHVSLAPVFIGRGDQFYFSNPVGAPPASVLVSPWINVLTGEQWTAQGDEAGPNAARYWAKTLYTHSLGSTGARQTTSAASTTTHS